MYSTEDLDLPRILFVGRPGDSRKGAVTLFDALEILGSYTDLPEFAVWLVGGSPREVDLMRRMIGGYPVVQAKLRAGTLVLWGRVENDALPEFYSRARVLVVPSWREEFGIVAVEAMMCGCPVVASNAGGLADIVIPGVTGNLVPIDDPPSLAAVLSAYLRCPARATVYGRNAASVARMRFSQDRTLQQVRALYQGSSEEGDTDWSGDPLRFAEPASLATAVEHVLGGPVQELLPVQDGQHTTFKVTAGDAQYFAKFFRERVSLMSAVLPNSGFESRRPG